MKRLFKLLFFLGFVAGVAYLVQKALSPQETPDQGSGSGVLPETPPQPLEEAHLGGEVSPELLKILVDPVDKGPLELTEDGKFLLNPRTGYRYPIRNGIPVMLVEEGKKYQDPSLIRNNGKGEAQESGETARE